MLSLLIPGLSGWNDCEFPDVGYFALDHGVGKSYTYALAAMNGNLYSGGYTKGNFAFVGITDTGDVTPEPSATIWGDTTSDEQSLYIAEVSTAGKMTNAWLLRGSAIQSGEIGHGTQTNSIDSSQGLHAMNDKKHIAVKGGFRKLLFLPDGTRWSTEGRKNTKDQRAFILKLDVSHTQGVGAGTTGWGKLMDEQHPGGATVNTVDGDAQGNLLAMYTGCADYDPTLQSTDRWGRTVLGGTTGCTHYLTKLSAVNGSTVWEKQLPRSFSQCRVVLDGSMYCGWTMSSADGQLDFGNGVLVSSVASTVGIIKYNADGVALWAKSTAAMSFGGLSIDQSANTLAVIGSANRVGKLARISLAGGDEGRVMWTDSSGVGTHGFRGVEVTHDGAQVAVMGQITDMVTITDESGVAHTLRSRGSYEVFVAAFDASNGDGKWAMDGGGTGMEYFFAMASDPDTHAFYVGGTSRSEYITWGDVKRKNVMYNGQPGQDNPDQSSPVGSSKAFTVQLTSTMTGPSCLSSCAFNSVRTADVKSGFCYIDRHCYADGQPSPFAGHECHSCNAQNPLTWSSPDTSQHCFINDKCVASGVHNGACEVCNPSTSTTAYSKVAGCMLPSTFQAGCYTQEGNHLLDMDRFVSINSTAQQLARDLESQAIRSASELSTCTTEKSTAATQLTACTSSAAAEKTQLTAALDRCEEQKTTTTVTSDDGINKTLAIAIIVVIGVLFMVVLLMMSLIISREKQGKPIFTKMTLDAVKDVQYSSKA